MVKVQRILEAIMLRERMIEGIEKDLKMLIRKKRKKRRIRINKSQKLMNNKNKIRISRSQRWTNRNKNNKRRIRISRNPNWINRNKNNKTRIRIRRSQRWINSHRARMKTKIRKSQHLIVTAI